MPFIAQSINFGTAKKTGNMKKLRLVLPLIGMAAMTTLYLMKPTHEASSSSSIMLENVEALGSGESRTGCKFSLQYICVTQNKDHISYRNL